MPKFNIDESDRSIYQDQQYISISYNGNVNVEGLVPTPVGTIEIAENGNYEITNYATANVNVPNPSSGTIEITENGEYDVADYATADVNIQSGASLNIAYGDTAPEDTSKLWIKANEPTNLEFGYNLENGVESIHSLTTMLPNVASGITGEIIETTAYLFNGDKVYKFDTRTNAIETLDTTLPTSVKNMASATVGDKIYLFGGINADNSLSDKIYVFDTENNIIETLDTTLPTACYGISSEAVGDKIYLFGGNVGNSSPYALKTVNIFDTKNNTITTLSVTIPEAGRRASILIGNKVYLFGGLRGTARYNSIHMFNVENNTFTTITTTLPRKIENMSSIAIGSKVYLFGGKWSNDYAWGSSKEIYKFDTETNTIETLETTLSAESEGITSVAIGTKVYLFGGDGRNTIELFAVTFPLTNGDIFVQEDFTKNRFDILSSPTEVSIGVRDVFIGNDNNEAEKAEAYLYDEDAEEWKII